MIGLRPFYKCSIGMTNDSDSSNASVDPTPLPYDPGRSSGWRRKMALIYVNCTKCKLMKINFWREILSYLQSLLFILVNEGLSETKILQKYVPYGLKIIFITWFCETILLSRIWTDCTKRLWDNTIINQLLLLSFRGIGLIQRIFPSFNYLLVFTHRCVYVKRHWKSE